MQFLTVDEAAAIHEQLASRFGGRPGVRDPGMLESALFRPQTGCYEDLVSMASALFESLLFNPAFHDANERTAFFATDVFLRLNGWKLQVEPAAAVDFIAKLGGRGQAERQALLPLFRHSIVRAEQVPLTP